MKIHIPSALFTYITTRTTKTYARCWLLTTKGGQTYAYTSHTRNIRYRGVTFFSSQGLYMYDIRSTDGTVPDSTSISAFLSSVGEQLIYSGVFDNAYMEIFIVNYIDLSMEHIIEKVGYLGEISRIDGVFNAELRGLTQILDTKIGRVFGASCDAILGDSRCGVAIFPNSDFYGTTTISTIVNKSNFFIGVSKTDGFLNQGYIKFTSGNNNGFIRDIRSQIGTSISTYIPFPFDIEIGDSIEFVAGCDKTAQTCAAKFNNKTNFRGFDHVPTNEDIFNSPIVTKISE